MKKKIVVIGFIGTQLDAGKSTARWEKWRPTVALTQQEDLLIDRLELLYSQPHQALVDLVVGDIAAVSPETQVRPTCLDIADPWDFGEVYAALFDFAEGYTFDNETEEYWLHVTTGTHVVQICMFLLTESRFLPGLLLQTSPSKRQNPGSHGTYTLIDLNISRYDQIAQRFAATKDNAIHLLKSGIATRNARFNRMITEIEQVAVKSRAPILLMGPTGSGKSFLARRVFELKKTRHQIEGRFVEVNCATLRGDGAASALFGHVKGAFTGAATERGGLLKAADKGLLFLDEIGELPLDEQAMLLKAIEEKRFYPVGSDREVDSDFRLIAGTNRDLRGEVRAGRFREDLYARINLWAYELPGLAERPEDIEPNIDYLLRRHGEELGYRVSFSTEARQTYLDFAQSREALWPGNFRDLGASLMRLATLAEGGRIALAQVDAEIARLRRQWGSEKLEAPITGPTCGLEKVFPPEVLANLDLFDQSQLETVLQVCGESSSLSEAGRRLFAASRAQRATPNDADRLRKYLAKFKLEWKALREIMGKRPE